MNTYPTSRRRFNRRSTPKTVVALESTIISHGMPYPRTSRRR